MSCFEPIEFWEGCCFEDERNRNDSVFAAAVDETPLWSAPFGAAILERVRLEKEPVVLDVGSGTGFPLLVLAGRLGPRARLFGLDPWAAGNERARQKLAEYGYRNTSILRGVAESVPLKDNTVGIVVSNNGLNNVQLLTDSLKECFRVCRPGGQLLTTLNLPDTMREFYTVFEQALKSKRVSGAAPRIAAHIQSKRPSIDDFTSALETSGFVVRDVYTDAFKWRFADGTALLRDYAIRVNFLPAWKELVPGKLMKRVFKEVEELLNEVAARQGECALTIPYACFDARKPH